MVRPSSQQRYYRMINAITVSSSVAFTSVSICSIHLFEISLLTESNATVTKKNKPLCFFLVSYSLASFLFILMVSAGRRW